MLPRVTAPGTVSPLEQHRPRPIGPLRMAVLLPRPTSANVQLSCRLPQRVQIRRMRIVALGNTATPGTRRAPNRAPCFNATASTLHAILLILPPPARCRVV